MKQVILPEFYFEFNYSLIVEKIYENFKQAFKEYDINILSNIKELNEKDKNKIREHIHTWIDISMDDFYDYKYNDNNDDDDDDNDDNDNDNVENIEENDNNDSIIYEFKMDFAKYYINAKIKINPI